MGLPPAVTVRAPKAVMRCVISAMTPFLLSLSRIQLSRPEVQMPPRQPCCSSNSVLAPLRAEESAAATPAGPAPQTTTSAESDTGMSRAGSHTDAARSVSAACERPAVTVGTAMASAASEPYTSQPSTGNAKMGLELTARDFFWRSESASYWKPNFTGLAFPAILTPLNGDTTVPLILMTLRSSCTE